jgi:hypothetical protein
MRYAIVINLDYDTNPADECRTVWIGLRQRMMDAGFRIEGRLFTTDLQPEPACDLARQVVDQLDQDPVTAGKGIYHFLKEFYGYDHSHAANLLLPPTDNIRIDEG